MFKMTDSPYKSSIIILIDAPPAGWQKTSNEITLFDFDNVIRFWE
jgi:hypothetical protein